MADGRARRAGQREPAAGAADRVELPPEAGWEQAAAGAEAAGGTAAVRDEPAAGGKGAQGGRPGRLDVWVAPRGPSLDPDPRLVLLREPDSPRAAAYRVLRYRLTQPPPGERAAPRVIGVTSPGRHDGKTSCAANLALTLSEGGRARVLLVEANLRNPALTELFGFLPPHCFAKQLHRTELPPASWQVAEVYSPALHVAAVRPSPETTGQPLLESATLALAMAAFRAGPYDFILVDTPPVLGAADVNLVAEVVDGVLLVARAGETQGTALRRAAEQLAPSRILGVALLGA